MVSTIEGTLKHVIYLSRHLNHCDLQSAIIAVLFELGIPTKGMGFDFVKNAIILFSKDPAQLITKGIYPAVGALYEPEIGAYQVEITIRRTIKVAWAKRNEELWSFYFPLDENGYAKRPTNAEFISKIARFLELLQGCCKEVDSDE